MEIVAWDVATGDRAVGTRFRVDLRNLSSVATGTDCVAESLKSGLARQQLECGSSFGQE